jgi:CubicO group peptidase (beta-lactamase class C family)
VGVHADGVDLVRLHRCGDDGGDGLDAGAPDAGARERLVSDAAARAAIRAVLQDAIARRVTPGGIVEAGSSTGARWTAVAGQVTYARDAATVTGDTIYDLASLTKVLATTTLAMQAHASGTLPLDAAVADRLADFPATPRVTVQDLLEHAAGYAAHRPYYLDVAGRRGYLARLAAEPYLYAPRSASRYTDLGFILLALLLEAAERAPIDTQFAAFTQEALGPVDLAFGVRPSWRGRAAPTNVDPWRERVVVERVHDGNAAALGGAAGHAGLFGTAAAVGTFARWFLALWRQHGTPWRAVTAEIAARFATRGQVPGSSRALGWDTMLPTSSCGSRLSPRAIGHTGFTGTSLWLDPDRDLYVVCLTNRVHPRGEDRGVTALRVAIHDTVAGLWDA